MRKSSWQYVVTHNITTLSLLR